MKLLFTGDINFRGLTEPSPEMCADILAEVLPYFEKADFRIVNLETPLADKEKHTPIKKSGITPEPSKKGFGILFPRSSRRSKGMGEKDQRAHGYARARMTEVSMFEKLKAFCDSFLELGVPGFDFAVYQDGKCILRHINGYSDLENKVKMNGMVYIKT